VTRRRGGARSWATSAHMCVAVGGVCPVSGTNGLKDMKKYGMRQGICYPFLRSRTRQEEGKRRARNTCTCTNGEVETDGTSATAKK